MGLRAVSAIILLTAPAACPPPSPAFPCPHPQPSNVLVTLRFIGELVVGLVVQLADLGYSRPIDFDRKTFTPGQFGTPGFQPVLSLVDTNLLGNLMIADLQLDVMGLGELG